MIHAAATQRPQGIPTLAQQVQAASAAAAAQYAEQLRGVCLRAARFGGGAAQHQAALHRQLMLAELAAHGTRTVRQMRDAIAASNAPGANPSLSVGAVYSLAADMVGRRWLDRSIPSRADTPVGIGRPGEYFITDRGIAALTAMRETNTTATGDH